MKKNKSIIWLGVVFLVFASCSKSNIENSTPPGPITTSPVVTIPTKIIYPSITLDSVSEINKTTSWYKTNKAFDELFNVHESYYWGFEITNSNLLVPYNTTTTSSWSASKSYYWNDLGTYLYTDLTGDGKKDLWAYYWKNPWPTNATGLHLFSEYVKDKTTADVQQGLTQVRKCVLADFNNDGQDEIMLFSSGYDGPPFPGDSLGIFYFKEKKYKYLNQDIGYFHGGATGDVNNDGLVDIIAYSGGSMIIPIHPTCYMNKGGGGFLLSNNIFKGFNLDGSDNYYTVDLFDFDGDGWLDLFLGGQENLRIIPNNKGIFDRSKALQVQSEKGLELMDMAFLDVDFDGKKDILTMSNKSGYNGFGLRLFLNKGDRFVDATTNYIDISSREGKNAWIKWIHLFDFDKDGDIDIVADGLFGELNGSKGSKIYWKNNEGRFSAVGL
ncbi:MAG: FG-GAP repeat domain-containing protein [Sediminibacterium sp.]